jgi:hypothetical protein
MSQFRIGEHSFRHCRCGRSTMSPQALLLALVSTNPLASIVCNKTKAVGARRCNTILINGGENFFLTQRDRLVELAAYHAVPTIYA